VTEQDKGGEHGGRLVEGVTAAGEGHHQRVKPSRADRDRDQHHHVEGPRPQRPHGAVEEDPGRVKHHRQAQQQQPDIVAQAERRGNGETKHVAADR
jgi:hypothetical protein